MDTGTQLVDGLFDAMMIDEEWSVRERRGFTWWGHRLAQRVTIDPPRSDHGFDVVRVRAETDVLKNVPEDFSMPKKIAALNAMATLSAFVWDPQRETVSLCCTVYAHEDNVDLAFHLAKAAIALQAADAHLKADGLAQVLRGRPDESNHPRSGRRREPDDMLRIPEMFAHSGREESQYG